MPYTTRSGPTREVARIRRALLDAMARAARAKDLAGVQRVYGDAFLPITEGMEDGARMGLGRGARMARVVGLVSPEDAIVQFARNRGMQIVLSLRNDAETTWRAFSGVFRTLPPAELSALLRATAGLDPRLARAVLNHRAALIGAGRSPSEVRRLMQAYGDRLRAYRANMIAKTEANIAMNAGQEIVWLTAKQRGLLSPTQRRVWIVTPDELLCVICDALDGTAVPIGSPWVLSDGRSISTPGTAHPHCRCTERLETVPS